VVPHLVDGDWSVFEGIYFGFISATTIGLGDFSYEIDRSYGIIMLWVLVSLFLFHAFLSNMNRLVNVVMLSHSVERDKAKVHDVLFLKYYVLCA
jgi:hypothetical protein